MKPCRLLWIPLTLSLALTTLAACSTPSPMSTSAYPMPSGTPYATAAPGGLASLLTGQVVTSEEAQLRDIQKRQILLDFPIKVGVVTYQLSSKLDATDLEASFDGVSKALKDAGTVRETILIPQTLVSGSVTVEELRRLGARFQCDIMVLVTGSHNFAKSKSQTMGFFDSFSDKINYESSVKLEAIALDVYTGTLLSPFDAAAKGGPFTLDQSAADYSQQAYNKQKEVEAKAWTALGAEAVERMDQLKADVDKRKAEIAANPTPTPRPTAEPTPAPTASPTPVPSPSPTASPSAEGI